MDGSLTLFRTACSFGVRLPRAAILLSAFLLLPIGCNSLRPGMVAAGVPRAHTLIVEPFVIATNSRLSESDPLVEQLLALQSHVQHTLQLTVSDRQVEIYIFDDRRTYDSFIEFNYPELPRRRAFFIAQDQRKIVYTFRGEKLEEDLRHEAAHALVHAAAGNLPLWLDEGIAEYMELPTHQAGLHVQHLAELRQAMRTGWRPGLTRLESIQQLQQMTASDYGEAWAWTYFLLHSSSETRQLLIHYLAHASTSGESLSAALFRIQPQANAALVRFLEQLDDTRPASD